MSAGRRPALAALIAGSSLALAGCGSAPLSLRQLRTRAGVICTRAERGLAAITAPTSAKDAAAFLDHGLALLRPELGSLQSLSVGGDAHGVYATALSAQSAEISSLSRASGALHANSTPTGVVTVFKTLQSELGPIETQANNAWQALGIPTCESH